MGRGKALEQEERFSSEETPSADIFVQLAARKTQRSQKRLPMVDDESSEEFEYGGEEVHARDVDSSGYSIHQFWAIGVDHDEPKNNEDEDQGFAMARGQALEQAEAPRGRE